MFLLPRLVPVRTAHRSPPDDRLDASFAKRRMRSALVRSALCLGAAFSAAAAAPPAKLRAAPPESIDSETEEAKKERPAIGDPKVHEKIWDLTFEEALRTALKNSKAVQKMGGLLLTPDAPQADPKPVASQGPEGAAQDPKAVGVTKVRFVLVRTNKEIAPADFEASVSKLISDVQLAYWDLYYNYHNLHAARAGRDSASQICRDIHALRVTGKKGGEPEKETQAQGQYLLFKAQVEIALGPLHAAESRLRDLMGLMPADGRPIRPCDEPTMEEVRFDWNAILRESLERDVDVSPDEERELANELVNSVRTLGLRYQMSRVTFNRRVAAAKQLQAVTAACEAGTATFDMLLDAQRRLPNAEIAYYRALADYNLALAQVHYRKGSLLEHSGILPTWQEKPPIDPFRPRVRAGK